MRCERFRPSSLSVSCGHGRSVARHGRSRTSPGAEAPGTGPTTRLGCARRRGAGKHCPDSGCQHRAPTGGSAISRSGDVGPGARRRPGGPVPNGGPTPPHQRPPISRSLRWPECRTSGLCRAPGSPTGPGQRGLDLPARIGTARLRRHAHRHAGREVEPARDRDRGRGLTVGERDLHHTAPVVGRATPVQPGRQVTWISTKYKRPVRRERHPERVVLAGILARGRRSLSRVPSHGRARAARWR